MGASGWWQNPHGASISEESHTFALALDDGRPIVLPDGPRHSEARFALSERGRRLVVGGMVDGPGTHSADTESSLLRAAGFVTSVR